MRKNRKKFGYLTRIRLGNFLPRMPCRLHIPGFFLLKTECCEYDQLQISNCIGKCLKTSPWTPAAIHCSPLPSLLQTCGNAPMGNFFLNCYADALPPINYWALFFFMKYWETQLDIIRDWFMPIFCNNGILNIHISHHINCIIKKKNNNQILYKVKNIQDSFVNIKATIVYYIFFVYPIWRSEKNMQLVCFNQLQWGWGHSLSSAVAF